MNEALQKSECLKIGCIQKTHGINGRLLFVFAPEFADDVEKAEVFMLEIDGGLVPWFVAADGLDMKTDSTALVKLDWIDSEPQAKTLCGLSVYMRRDDVHACRDGEFSVIHLTGFTLIDLTEGRVGEIIQVDDYNGNILLTVDHHGAHIMTPFHDDLLVHLDHARHEITMRCPSGIFNTE
ncbi:MAG: ribosome maturation factor RimM [Bacteroidales bacterium]|jgi:16S rRNA processing protein RimM|nr:ribosome maturation factor RimM [Bacteroidales bacterium]